MIIYIYIYIYIFNIFNHLNSIIYIIYKLYFYKRTIIQNLNIYNNKFLMLINIIIY